MWYGSSTYNPDPAPSASQDESTRMVSPCEDSYVPALIFTVKDPSLAEAVAVVVAKKKSVEGIQPR